MKTAVVGHCEWIEFIRVAAPPRPGEIIHGIEAWCEPGGGGAVAAGQLAKLTGDCSFFTALGEDDLGRRMQEGLIAHGVDVKAAFNDEPQRRAVVFVDGNGERTITVLGTRMSPVGSDPLPWGLIDSVDAVFLTAGDPEAVEYARRARVLVATSRILPLLAESDVYLDALVGSASDEAERYSEGDLAQRPRLVVRTQGRLGGTFRWEDGPEQRYEAAPLPGPVGDFYGCGDSFAAGLTFGLGIGLDPRKAIAVAARCGAAVATGRGPFSAQLTREQLGMTEGEQEVGSQ